ncbi:MAG: transposase [Lachnospiraceae bacterium]|nr:transposase [Lachnospiraceae bacterium]
MSRYRNSQDYIRDLQYKVKALERKQEAFESGEQYLIQQKKYEKLLQEQRNTINHLKKELRSAHEETRRVRKYADEAAEDLIHDYEKKLAEKDREMEAMRRRLEKAEAAQDKEKEKNREKQQELYAVQTELEDEKELNRKLTAQINRDYLTSSIPSSMQSGVRKKIPNSREKSGRKPGAQKGHGGHARKKLQATSTREITAPAEILADKNYVETGSVISRQRISAELLVKVEEVTVKEYINLKTGKKWHPSFPKGFENDVNYDGSIKAIFYQLVTECNVAHDKAVSFIKMLSRGKLTISKGMVNHLMKEFSDKTQEEQKKATETLMKSPVLQTDFTNANVNGGSRQVLILGTPDGKCAKLIARAGKGHNGIRGTLLEVYTGILCHDHDSTFYSYGTGHQECIHHNYRYLKGNLEAEPEYPWSGEMRRLFLEMVAYRNSLPEGASPDPVMVAHYETRYDGILDRAEKEYEDNPPGTYNRESYKMYKRLRKYKESELLFLHDMRVPDNNDLCERLARLYKRKQKQATVFRSDASLIYICNGLSVVHDLKAEGKDLFEAMTEIFNRPQPPKKSLPEPVLVKSIDEDASQGDHTSEEKNNETDIAA